MSMEVVGKKTDLDIEGIASSSSKQLAETSNSEGLIAKKSNSPQQKATQISNWLTSLTDICGACLVVVVIIGGIKYQAVPQHQCLCVPACIFKMEERTGTIVP